MAAMVAATACCICEFGLALGKEHADTMWGWQRPSGRGAFGREAKKTLFASNAGTGEYSYDESRK